jgi:hypothetical protein
VLDWRERAQSFEAIEFWIRRGVAVRDPIGLRTVSAAAVSPGYLDLAGVRMLRGRVFAPVAYRDGDPRTAIISEKLWRSAFGGDEGIVGEYLDFGTSGPEGEFAGGRIGVALLVAGIGIYGTVLHGVRERVREFGVRIALGATGGRVQRMVLRQTAVPLACGVAAGLLAAVQSTRVLAALLFEIDATDAGALAIAAATLLVVGLAAAWQPARMAASVDPVEVLRAD